PHQSIRHNSRPTQMPAMAFPKRQYYYTSPLGRRVISLGLGPIALSFVGMAGREAIISVDGLMATHGTAWPAEWLHARGLAGASEAWRRLNKKEDPPCQTR